MRQFIYFILKTLVFLLFLIIIVDYGFKLFFINIHKRSKQDMVNQTFDVLFIGSSRCLHHINPILFNRRTGLRSYNLGYEASHIRENFATLKIYLNFNKAPKYIFLQIDDSEDKDTGVDEFSSNLFYKFHRRQIIDDYFTEDLNKTLRIPLLTYITIKNLSWREILKSTIKNELNMKKLGFGGRMGTFNTEASYKAKVSVDKNVWVEKFIQLCKKNNIKLMIFTSPIYRIENFERINWYGSRATESCLAAIVGW